MHVRSTNQRVRAKIVEFIDIFNATRFIISNLQAMITFNPTEEGNTFHISVSFEK